ncbi:unnamed protein product [Cuscuta campestris]|uniref:RRM domain-containing protein n=1 Tax=Cuscuta campestris TaxID=132261 RepID=A0A484NJR0_9ASTE|nr:unnamed protein product [Cuscuta campestris]
MDSSHGAALSASQVGSYFVQQYYEGLQQRPDCVHLFYSGASSIVRVDGESSQSASTLMDIQSLILSATFSGIKVKTINSLESWKGGVLVVVSGTVRLKDFGRWREFVQTFFLAPQDNGYFVLNDVINFGDDEVKNQPPPVAVADNHFGAQPTAHSPHGEAPASDYTLEEQAREYMNMVNLEGNNSVGEYDYSKYQQDLQEPVYEAERVNEEQPPFEEESYELQNNVEASEVPEPSWEEPVVETAKLSYASIVRAAKGKSPPSVSVQPTFAKSTPPPSEWQQSVVQQSNAISAVSYDNSHEHADEGYYQEGEPLSVYVRNLPTTVSTQDLFREFQNFGTIKQDGVFLRNRKEVGVCYAFVEFENIQGVQNALKASPIHLDGRPVFIEERRQNNNNNNNNMASRGGRGRGGRGRGRSGGRAFGRGTYQDNADYNRGKSNGFRAV